MWNATKNNAPSVITRNELMSNPFPPEWVPLPHRGEGKGVFVKVLSSKARDEIERSMIGLEHRDRVRNIRARLTVLTACDENGDRIFTDADADALGEQADHETLDLIFEAARKLNKTLLTEQEEKDEEKN